MPLEIKSSVADTLPSSVKNALSKLPPEEQGVFEEEYSKKMKNPTTMLLIAIFFPIHYFLLGETVKGVLFICTLGGMWIWWLIDIFRIKGMVNSYNEDFAKAQLRDMKIMSS